MLPAGTLRMLREKNPRAPRPASAARKQRAPSPLGWTTPTIGRVQPARTPPHHDDHPRASPAGRLLPAARSPQTPLASPSTATPPPRSTACSRASATRESWSPWSSPPTATAGKSSPATAGSPAPGLGLDEVPCEVRDHPRRPRPPPRRPRIQPPAPQDLQPDDARGRRPRSSSPPTPAAAAGPTSASSPNRDDAADRRNSDDRPGRTDAAVARRHRPRRQGPLPPGPRHLASRPRQATPAPWPPSPSSTPGPRPSTPPTRTCAAATASPPASAPPPTTSGPSGTTAPSASPTPAHPPGHRRPRPPLLHRPRRPWSSTRWPAAAPRSTSASPWDAAALRTTSHPVRPEIRTHDVRRRLSARSPRMRPVFCDPPYHTMLAAPVSGPEGVADAPLTAWIDFLQAASPGRLRDLRPGGLHRPAAGQPDREGPPRRLRLPRSRLLGYNALIAAGFLPERRISCPMDGAYLPQHVRRARADGRMLGQVRDLLVMRKPMRED